MRFSSLLAFVFVMLLAAPAFAQTKKDSTPDVPAPLQALVDRGAQIRYLGREHDMDGWIAIYQGQEQYYYITQDKKAFVTGLMFGEDGAPITINQVKELQTQGGNVLDVLAEDTSKPEDATKTDSLMESAAKKTPAERMYAEIENSNWIRLGSDKAPVIYTFIDPQCPHCHKMMTDLHKDYIDSGLLQVRIIPVGFQDGSLAQASFLLAAPDAESRFWKHLDGDKEALLAKSDISTQAIQKNMALMQSWKFNVTPLTAYRAKDGKIKIVRGVVKDIPALLGDLPAPGAAAAPTGDLEIPGIGR